MSLSLDLSRTSAAARPVAPVNLSGLTRAGLRQALIDAIVNLSQLAFNLRDSIAEIDINPVIVNASDAIAVDALILCDAPGS